MKLVTRFGILMVGILGFISFAVAEDTFSIKVSADCAEVDNPLIYSKNKKCVQNSIQKLAQMACFNHNRSLARQPVISQSCSQQNNNYICRGEALATCGGQQLEVITQSDDWLESQ